MVSHSSHCRIPYSHGDHQHSHDGHGHHHHSHAHSHNHDSQKRLKLILILTSIFMLIEFVAGYWINSLALIGDAVHMLADIMGLSLAWISLVVSNLPTTERRTFGFKRAEILGAFLNALFLLILAGSLIWGAVHRLGSPPEIDSIPMMGVAALGLVCNLIVGWILMKDQSDNLAIRGALLHVMGDALGSVGALVAGILIYWKGWYSADAVTTFVVAALVCISSVGLLKQSARILLQFVPEHLKYQDIETVLRALPSVRELHDLHVWALTQNQIFLSVHLVSSEANTQNLLKQAKAELLQKFKIHHSSIQIESEDLGDCCKT